MKKVLVTGANGFIGSSLLHYLSDNDVEVFAVIKDISERVNHIESLKNVHIVYCDMDSIEKLPDLIDDCDIDTCIHLAWVGSFGELRADYALQLKNIDYAMRTINTIYEMGIKRFVCAGTLAEKDVLNYHPTEGATPNPISMYGIAKITTHFMTKTECTKLGIEHIWCYLSNTYGVGNTTNNFVNMACKKLLNNERAAFTSGEQYYDFMYISDTVRAIFRGTDCKFLINQSLSAFQVVPVKVHTERNILRGILLASLGHSLRRAYVTRILNTAVLGHLYIVPVGRYVHLVNVTAVVGVDPGIKHGGGLVFKTASPQQVIQIKTYSRLLVEIGCKVTLDTLLAGTLVTALVVVNAHVG